MDLHLKGKRALVTGATSGLGAVIARALAAEGVSVAVGGRDRGRGDASVQAICNAGGTAVSALGDLSCDSGADACFSAAKGALGGIDILINAMGYSPGIGRLQPDGSWAEAYRTLTLPGVRMVHRISPGMKEAGWGRIIQIGSADALTPAAVPQAYASAKAAVANMSLGLAKAFAGTGITVNTISPGLAATPAYAEEDENALIERHGRQSVNGMVPLDGIAAMAVWLASPLASHVSGANIRIDGGFSPAIN